MCIVEHSPGFWSVEAGMRFFLFRLGLIHRGIWSSVSSSSSAHFRFIVDMRNEKGRVLREHIRLPFLSNHRHWHFGRCWLLCALAIPCSSPWRAVAEAHCCWCRTCLVGGGCHEGVYVASAVVKICFVISITHLITFTRLQN